MSGPDLELAAMELWDRGATAVEERSDRLVASFPSSSAARLVAAELGAGIEELDRSWVDAWRDFATPIVAGDLVVAPAWRPVPVGDARTVVTVDPGALFGSGSHPSTRLLLQLLAASPPLGLSVADIGTGSGILAVAAAVLGARSVAAVDIDPSSPSVVAANAARNGVDAVVSPAVGSSVPGPVDLALVNVTAAVQLSLAAGVRAAVAPGGRILLAGLLPGQWRHVASAYADCTVDALPELDGWMGADLRVP